MFRKSVFITERNFITEFENDKGKKIRYDGCSSKSLNKAKEFYTQMDYIGSGKITYHNGMRNEWDEIHHFFKFK